MKLIIFKIIMLNTLFLFSNNVFANIETKILKTPRGSLLEMTIHSLGSEKKPTIIIAPGQSCNSKGPI